MVFTYGVNLNYFYIILNIIQVCTNLLPPTTLSRLESHMSKSHIGSVRGLPGFIIQDEILAQATDSSNPGVGLPYECLLMKLHLAVGIEPTKDSESICHIDAIDHGTISRSIDHTHLRNRSVHVDISSKNL